MTEFTITKEDAERISRRTYLLASLIARDPDRLFWESYNDTTFQLTKAGIKWQQMDLGGCSDLAFGRNMMASRFLSSGCTDLIWLDDDITWRSEDIMRLIVSEQDVIGGVYRRKISEYPDDHPLSWAFAPLPFMEREIDKRGARTIKHNGFGFMKTSREALERIVAEIPDLPKILDDKSAKGNLYRFFYFDGLGGSEDYHFCQLWRSIGGKVWADPAIRLGHVGKHAFVGDAKLILRRSDDDGG